MGRRKWGMTQAEQKQHDKSSFMDGRLTQFNDLLTGYFLSHGHFVLPQDIGRADPALVTPIAHHAEQFYYAQRLVRDGGPLTGKRKEIMLEAVYAIEGLIDNIGTPHDLAALYPKYKSAKSNGTMLLWLSALCGAIAFLFMPFWLVAVLLFAGAGRCFVRADMLARRMRESALMIVSRL